MESYLFFPIVVGFEIHLPPASKSAEEGEKEMNTKTFLLLIFSHCYILLCKYMEKKARYIWKNQT